MIWRRRKVVKPAPAHTDWLGNPLEVGSRVTWPCDAHKSGSVGTATKQMAVGVVTEIGESFMRIRVEKRSRTGAPKLGYDRSEVKLGAVGMANVTVAPQ